MTTPKGINWNEQFYKLLRLSLRLTQEFIHIQLWLLQPLFNLFRLSYHQPSDTVTHSCFMFHLIATAD